MMLAGELTLPKGDGPFPGVVLISGSERADRNSFILGHFPFLVLADYLTRRGLAVFRYDVRGYGKSTGDLHAALDADFSADAAAGLRWLRSQKKIDAHRVGYIGHSQGETKAAMAAQIERPDFMIFIAGGLEGMGELLLRQGRDIAKAAGMSARKLQRVKQEIQQSLSILQSSTTPEQARTRIKEYILSEGGGIILAKKVASVYTTPWLLDALKGSEDIFHKVDSEISGLISSYEGPILALYGEKDLLVSARVEIPLVKPLLKNRKSRVITFPGLNHLLQPVPETDGLPRQAILETCHIETTIDPKVLRTIGDWLDTILK